MALWFTRCFGSHIRFAGCKIVFESRPASTVSLKTNIVDRIRHFGPLTIYEFMKECLTNPTKGYYLKNEVFGKEGDFITSPDICQIFGEIIGVWLVNQWRMTLGSRFQLVELGPGRGTLISDILRVFHRFQPALENVKVSLVEISPTMRQRQSSALELTFKKLGVQATDVQWYNELEDVPRGIPTLFVAHEFFDSLPIHQFRKDEKGHWREVLVDVAPVNPQQKEDELRLVLSPATTVAQVAYLNNLNGILNNRSCVEISPRTLLYVNEVCQRLQSDGGAALLIDYGHLGEKGDTLRAFKNHRICDLLSEPGETDVTYDVDFSQLCHRISSSRFKIDVHGPECQAYFLINMGLLTRLEKLLSNCRSESQQDELLSGCEMLITEEQMGSRFKVMAILPRDKEKRPVPGFVDLPGTPYFNKSGNT